MKYLYAEVGSFYFAKKADYWVQLSANELSKFFAKTYKKKVKNCNGL